MIFSDIEVSRIIRIILKGYILPFFLEGNKPDFMIVGAQKSGTTSLFRYLAEAPGIVGSQPKEVHFFDRDDNYRKGFNWYEKHFIAPFQKNVLFFEASPTYLFREKVPERLKSYNPNLKIIVLLREPISRAYSAWNMYRQWSEEGFIPHRMRKDIKAGYEPPLYKTFYKFGCPSFSDYIRLEKDLIKKGDTTEEPSLLRRGIYRPQVARYFDYFGRDNVLVVGFNELKVDSRGVVQKCQDFLGVPFPERSEFEVGAIKNKRSYLSEIKNEDRRTLESFYERPNEELFELLGFRPDW